MIRSYPGYEAHENSEAAQSVVHLVMAKTLRSVTWEPRRQGRAWNPLAVACCKPKAQRLREHLYLSGSGEPAAAARALEARVNLSTWDLKETGAKRAEPEAP